MPLSHPTHQHPPPLYLRPIGARGDDTCRVRHRRVEQCGPSRIVQGQGAADRHDRAVSGGLWGLAQETQLVEEHDQPAGRAAETR